MSLSGVITTFPVGPYQYPYFTSGDQTASRAIVFIGGLTNGMVAVPFTFSLNNALEKARWKLIQFHWSSAYAGYGTGSLDRDREEMQILIKHLKSTGIKTIVIMGHSTGSQNVMHYISSPDNNTPEYHVEGGIMQAPVADREYASDFKPWTDHLALAEQWIKEGKGNHILPYEICQKAGFGDVEMNITAYRLFSLIGQGGDDDYFSSDVPPTPTPPFSRALSTSFGALTVPALALYAEKDSEHQLSPPEKLLPKWEEAAQGKLDWNILKGASHDVSEVDAQKVLCEEVIEWIKKFE